MPNFDKIGVQDLYGGEQGETAGTFARKSRMDPRNTVTLGKAMQYVPVTMFGATGDGVTDDTTAIQNAINYAATNKLHTVYLHAGQYRTTSTIYMCHNATSNTGFPSSRDGRVTLMGEGKIDGWAYASGSGSYYGTLIVGDDDVSPVIEAANASTYVPQVKIQSMSIIGNNTGQVVKFQRAAQQSGLSNVFIGQNGTGNGFELYDGQWFSFIRDCWIQSTGTYSGIGAYISNPDGDPHGVINVENTMVKNFDTGYQIGEVLHGAGSAVTQVCLRASEAALCNIGVLVGSAVNMFTFENGYAEACETAGFIIRSGAGQTYINSRFWGNDVDIQIGVNDADQDKAHQIMLDRCSHVTNAETTAQVKIYASGNITKIIINQPNFYSAHGLDHAIELEDAQYYGISVIQPRVTGITQLCADSSNADMSHKIMYNEASGYDDIEYTFQKDWSKPNFRLRNINGSGGEAPLGIIQDDNAAPFIEFEIDYTPYSGQNPNVRTLTGAEDSGAGILAPFERHVATKQNGWQFYAMVRIRIYDSDTDTEHDVYFPTYKVHNWDD